MSAPGQLRRSQIITTYGPGALVDLPDMSVIIGGLDSWPRPQARIVEPRLARKIQALTGGNEPDLYAPPTPDPASHQRTGIGAWRFPEWFVVQDQRREDRSRRLVRYTQLDRGRFDGQPVVATRFVRACPRGHVADVAWRDFVHKGQACERRDLWLDEQGTSGDFADFVVRCDCGARRSLYDATVIEAAALGTCPGLRPWLGPGNKEPCSLPSRLLIRTASNAYFAQVMSALALPDPRSRVRAAVEPLLDKLCIVRTREQLTFLKEHPDVAEALRTFADEDVLEAIAACKGGPVDDRPVKLVELDALVSVPEGLADGEPSDPDFQGRRLPDRAWREPGEWPGVEAVFQLHRLREVLALVGFTRLEPAMPDIHGEYDSDVQRAPIADHTDWFPAVENRGEGIFVQLSGRAVQDWLVRHAVQRRLASLEVGHHKWADKHRSKRPFVGGPYVLLHTLSHLLIQSIGMCCGYPSSAIRERVYVDAQAHRYGFLLYTGSPDSEGTLGGLVQQARQIGRHLDLALRAAGLCSNDPICAQHSPDRTFEERLLDGSACHGCALIAETSCEMRNDYLDRALVVPVLGLRDAAFFDDVLTS